MKTSNMTLTAYECRVTEIIDELRGDEFDWPESREGDIHACFLRHMQPEEAADHLLSLWESSQPEYRIAFVRENGGWDVVETFHASDDDAANAHAEEHYGEQEWYVLDHTGKNINGGVDG